MSTHNGLRVVPTYLRYIPGWRRLGRTSVDARTDGQGRRGWRAMTTTTASAASRRRLLLD